MVNYHKYFLFISIWSFFIYSGSDEEFFLRANKLGKECDWQQALILYQSMKKKGSFVWYNMGNCYYHLKDYVQALTCWKRAEPGASRALYLQNKYNQNILAQKLNKPISTSWAQKLYTFFESYIQKISLLLLQILFLCCWFILYFLTKYKNKILFYFVSLFIMLLGCLTGIGITIKYQQTDKAGIIATDQVKVFAGPNQEYHVLDELNHIDQVTIQDCKPDDAEPHWYKVKYATGTGWITADTIQVV